MKLIDSDALREKLPYIEKHSLTVSGAIENVNQTVALMPGIFARPDTRGWWVLDPPDANGDRKPRCSRCGRYTLSHYGDYVKCHFCPECGAKLSILEEVEW